MRVLIAVALLAAATLARAETSTLEFKGIALGSDISAYEGNKRFFCMDSKSAVADRMCAARHADSETIAGVAMKGLILFFYDGKLHRIMITFDSKEYSTVLDALTEKYGKPISATERIQNRMGAEFENETNTWNKTEQTLKAQKYTGKITVSSVTFQTDAGYAEFNRRFELQKKAGAKDL